MKKYIVGLMKDESGQGLMIYGIGIFCVTFALIVLIGFINGDIMRIYAGLTTPKR